MGEMDKTEPQNMLCKCPRVYAEGSMGKIDRSGLSLRLDCRDVSLY